MPTQKTFKRRVRTRMAKTGESYTAARRQLIRKASETAEQHPVAAEAEAATAPATAVPAELLTSDDSMRKATGKGHGEWFAILDTWGATGHTHTEIARWLNAEHGVAGWWSQNITVNYERARGMRRPGQMADGFSVSATRTIGAEPEQILKAFTDAAVRKRWLPGAPMRQRPTRAALTARFDWAEPKSRVVVIVGEKGTGKAVVTVTCEQVPDADAAEALKARWRASLSELKAMLEQRGAHDHG
ncbi:MAG TPA: DUF4287 domain-containing protein [Candidatus Limnocylindrales bacterium]|nr:DUF4287 domain-containing protein [Candidatus Limnocylindrales bacterium]